MSSATPIHLGGAAASRRGQRMLRFPLTRIVLALVFFMLPFLLIQAGATHFFDLKLYSRTGQLVGALVGCLSYAFYVTRVEGRAVSELGLEGAWREYGAGFVLGALMVCASVAGIAALGGLRALSLAPGHIIVLPLLMHITVGLVEEMLMRGIFFKVVEQSAGSWLALLASGLLFGAMHLVNDNISLLGIANIAASGVFFAAAFLLTGRLWLCAALHAGWNFAQDGIFSLAVSGHQVKQGLLVTELSGPDWLTGGAFGIEGSAVDLVLVLLAGAAMVMLARHRGRMLQPVWTAWQEVTTAARTVLSGGSGRRQTRGRHCPWRAQSSCIGCEARRRPAASVRHDGAAANNQEDVPHPLYRGIGFTPRLAAPRASGRSSQGNEAVCQRRFGQPAFTNPYGKG